MKGVMDALETLVESRVPTPFCLFTGQDLPLDDDGSGGDDGSHRPPGSDQHGACVGAKAHLLRPHPGLFSQFRIGPRYTHPHLAQPGLQSASGHPSRRGQAGAGGRWDQGRQRLLRNRSHHSQAACPGHPSGHARQEECGGLVSDTPPPPGRSRRRGRPRKYGKKIKVSSLLKNVDRLQEAGSPIYGEAASSC